MSDTPSTPAPAATTDSAKTTIWTKVGVLAVVLLIIAYLLPEGGLGLGRTFANIARGAEAPVQLVENSKTTIIMMGVALSLFFLFLVGVALAATSIVAAGKKK